MYKAKHIAWYYNLFPRINPSFSYCNRVSLFSVTHYILVIYKPLPIFQHLYYFTKPILFHYSIICPYHSFRLLFVSLFRYYTPSPWEKSPNRRVCDWGEDILSIICSSFLYLPVWLAPSFVRLLFVFCSSFVRLLFVFCSSFVRLLFVFPISSLYLHYFILSPLFANSQIC